MFSLTTFISLSYTLVFVVLFIMVPVRYIVQCQSDLPFYRYDSVLSESLNFY